MKRRTFNFPVHDWIDTKEGLVAQKELSLSSNGFQDDPVKSLPTSSQSGTSSIT